MLVDADEGLGDFILGEATFCGVGEVTTEVSSGGGGGGGASWSSSIIFSALSLTY